MSVKFTQRVPDELHAKVKELAGRRGVSMNDFINALLSDAVESDEVEAMQKEIEELRAEIKALTKK